MSPTKVKSTAKEKKAKLTKKAPGAPKRFCSSYILFFMHHQKSIKDGLPKDSEQKASEVSKRASNMWKQISIEERQYWKGLAAKEKERYIAEKEVYDGPWEVSTKRAKKDPDAPKRNPSAFLLYSIQKRKSLKESDPCMSNTEISRILGLEWSKTSEDEKRPFIEQEARERIVYKQEAAAWRAKKAVKQQEENMKRSQLIQEKIRIAQTHELEEEESHFYEVNDNPQESSNSKKSDYFEDNGWLDHIADLSAQPLSQEDDSHRPERYSPVAVPSNFGISCNTSFETNQMTWIASENRNSVFFVKPKPHFAHRFTSSSPFRFRTSPIESEQIIDHGPLDCSPFGSNDEQDEHVSIL